MTFSSNELLVAIAYLMQKAPYVFPIIGGRKVEHFYANLEALDIALTPEQIKTLDNIVPFDKGFPYGFVSNKIMFHMHWSSI
jgi:aryl-alcohol dehydrogenase-like predicted oxidoreductase